jgi:hypothetical protein
LNISKQILKLLEKQCSEHFGTDPDPDPGLIVSDLHDAKKPNFFADYRTFEGTFTSFFKG